MRIVHGASENTAEMKKLAALTFLGALALAPSHARAETDLRVQASRMLSAMEGDAHRVALLLRSARAAHSVNAAKCIGGFLSQIDAGVRHGRDDVADLRAALAQNDLEAARRSLSWLASRREAARWASFSADTCNGNVAPENDRTEVHIVPPPKLPSDRDVFAR
jgi:hypothetical protein